MLVVLSITMFAIFVCWLVYCVCDARAGDEDRWYHNKDHKWW